MKKSSEKVAQMYEQIVPELVDDMEDEFADVPVPELPPPQFYVRVVKTKHYQRKLYRLCKYRAEPSYRGVMRMVNDGVIVKNIDDIGDAVARAKDYCRSTGARYIPGVGSIRNWKLAKVAALMIGADHDDK